MRNLKNSIKKRTKFFRKLFKGFNAIKRIDSDFYLSAPPEVLLVKNYIGTEFQRYDTIVRYLTADRFYNNYDNTFDLYKKMQNERGTKIEAYTDTFIPLMHSYVNNGYSASSMIEVSREGFLRDGSHRLALSLYFNLELISCDIKTTGKKRVVKYGLDWFKKNKFTSTEIDIIKQTKESLFFNKGLYFPLIIWPPAYEIFNEIVSYLNTLEVAKVIKLEQFSLSDKIFRDFVVDVYKTDDIDSWKVKNKLISMNSYKKDFNIIWLELGDPIYRRKSSNSNLISTKIEIIKDSIRKRFQNRIEDYYYDNLCHSGDNFKQNKQILDLVNQLMESL